MPSPEILEQEHRFKLDLNFGAIVEKGLFDLQQRMVVTDENLKTALYFELTLI